MVRLKHDLMCVSRTLMSKKHTEGHALTYLNKVWPVLMLPRLVSLNKVWPVLMLPQHSEAYSHRSVTELAGLTD